MSVENNRKKFTDAERTELLAAFDLRLALTNKALARKFGRSPRAIESLDFRYRRTKRR
jgi:hypothetical protein